jgi:hypothetical protein
MLQSNTTFEICQNWQHISISFGDCSPEQSHVSIGWTSEKKIPEFINVPTIRSKVQPPPPAKPTLLSRLLTDAVAPVLPKNNVGTLCVEAPALTQPEAEYETVWGSITFTQLYEQTHRYAAHLLREDPRYRDNDVDDGLQVGYLKLWQRLQVEPGLLVGRRIGWISKFLFYSAVHTRQKEQRISKRQVETPEGESEPNGFVGSITSSSKVARPHSHESRQADKRIDLAAAIVATANHIMEQLTGIHQDRALWTLYCITSLHIQVTAASQLFRVHHRAMKQAYETVRSLLQQHLEGYTPHYEIRPIRAPAQQPQPYQDICAIRQQNVDIAPEYFEKAQQYLEQQCPDTLDRDLVALQGIREQVTAKAQAHSHALSYSSMQRAYERIHLLLASLRDETITPRRPQKIRAKPFVFCPEYEPLIQSVATEMLSEPNSQGKLIALYSYLCNIPNRESARNFQMSEATLRNYRQRIQERFTVAL